MHAGNASSACGSCMVQATWSNPATAGFATVYPTNAYFTGVAPLDFINGVKIYPLANQALTSSQAGLKALELKLDRAYGDITGRAAWRTACIHARVCRERVFTSNNLQQSRSPETQHCTIVHCAITRHHVQSCTISRTISAAISTSRCPIFSIAGSENPLGA